LDLFLTGDIPVLGSWLAQGLPGYITNIEDLFLRNDYCLLRKACVFLLLDRLHVRRGWGIGGLGWNPSGRLGGGRQRTLEKCRENEVSLDSLVYQPSLSHPSKQGWQWEGPLAGEGAQGPRRWPLLTTAPPQITKSCITSTTDYFIHIRAEYNIIYSGVNRPTAIYLVISPFTAAPIEIKHSY
jgi:hypothetical protein